MSDDTTIPLPTAPERVSPEFAAGERAMLDQWLDFHRATLAVKCHGLTGAQLKQRAVEPSVLSLLGLVRHMAEVERHWFRAVLDGEDLGGSGLYWSKEEPDGDFLDTADADAVADLATWQGECDRSRALAAGVPLDTPGKGLRHGRQVTLRWILTHMIEEYARHNGHADLLRERVDGVTGE